MFKEVNKKVYNILKDIEERTYPVVAPVGTEFPFIIYRRTSDSYDDNKDAVYEHFSSFEVTIVSNDYEESIDILEDVAEALMSNEFKVLNVAEYYGDGAYIQTLQIQNN